MLLGQEVPDLEGATRCIWKDETAELAQLKASLKQVQTQVKLDKIAEFTDSMGLFQADASKKVEALAAVHAETQAAIPPTRTPTTPNPNPNPSPNPNPNSNPYPNPNPNPNPLTLALTLPLTRRRSTSSRPTTLRTPRPSPRTSSASCTTSPSPSRRPTSTTR